MLKYIFIFFISISLTSGSIYNDGMHTDHEFDERSEGNESTHNGHQESSSYISNELDTQLLELAIFGIKSYREVDYTDQDYEGYRNSETFTVGFRNTLFMNAEYQLDYVKSNEIIRTIQDTEVVPLQVEDEYAIIELYVTEVENVLGEERVHEHTYQIYLSLIGDTWFISNIVDTSGIQLAS